MLIFSDIPLATPIYGDKEKKLESLLTSVEKIDINATGKGAFDAGKIMISRHVIQLLS